jgi:hypothetical protein
MIATLDESGTFTQRSAGAGWDASWTQIAGSLHGGVVFYKASNGLLVTGKLDGAGNFSNWKTLPAAATGFTRVTAARENGLLFFNGSTGAVRTAQLDDFGNVTWKAADQWWNGYSHIVGGLNGSLFLYHAGSGYTYTVTMDAGYALRWVGPVSGIAAGHIVTSAGGAH